MPKSIHRVVVESRTQDLPKAGAGIDMTIYRQHKVLGRLTIGRGGIRWTASRKSIPRRVSWLALAAMMER